MGNPDNLRDNEKDTVLRFFLFYMPMEQRGQLMAQHPLIYGHLYPDVPKETIANKVHQALRAQDPL